MAATKQKVINGNGKQDPRKEVLDLALKEILKRYGDGAVMLLGEATHMKVEAIPTGSLALDIALGIGGIARGRVTEIYGPEASGKTTLAQHVIAEAQKLGGVCAFIDMEHALDPAYAECCGVDIDNLYISQPDTGEQALEITETLVRSGAVAVVVVDSVAALVPRSEIEGDMGDATMGMQARLMSQALRKLTGAISKANTIVIFINQIRMKIGVMFGNPETTPGGRALKFYASIRLDIRRIGSIKEGETVIGNRVRTKVVKNKVAAPFRQAEFDIMFDSGISAEGDLLDLAIDDGLVNKSGSWFSYKQVRLGQGRENVKQFLIDNPDLYKELKAAVLAKRNPESGEAESDGTSESKRPESSPKLAKKKKQA